LFKVVQDESSKLSLEDRGYLRKRWYTIAKHTINLKIESDKRIKLEEIMAKNAKLDDLYVQVFDGERYASWKTKLLLALEYKECLDPAKRQRGEEEEAVWKKTDLKARYIITCSISDRQLEYIQNCKTALEMMSTLDRIYMAESTPMQINCIGKLDDIRLKNFKSSEEFFLEFEKLCNDYTAAGGTIKEEEKVRYMIKALPPSLSQIGIFIDLVPKDQRNIEYLKTKIREVGLLKKEPEERPTVSTFNTKTKQKGKGLCFTCGKPGHKQRDCWHNKDGQQQQHKNFGGNFSQRGRGGNHRGRGGRGGVHQQH